MIQEIVSMSKQVVSMWYEGRNQTQYASPNYKLVGRNSLLEGRSYDKRKPWLKVNNNHNDQI